jgi:hypothetical protein
VSRSPRAGCVSYAVALVVTIASLAVLDAERRGSKANITTITASFASWFLDRIAELTAAERRAEVTLEQVSAELQQLRAEVRALPVQGAGSAGST